MDQEINVPKGYRQNAQGNLVPESKIKLIDKERDQCVMEMIKQSRIVQEQLQRFKADSMSRIETFLEHSAAEYQVELGGKKGNVSLVSFDGRYKVQRSVSEYITFDERLQVAKTIIDSCIHRWAKNANNNIKALVEHAFQTDKEGKISVGRIFGLLRLDINDEEWNKAMEAIRDSIQIVGSRSYVRFYERIDDTDRWKQIPLDIAAL